MAKNTRKRVVIEEQYAYYASITLPKLQLREATMCHITIDISESESTTTSMAKVVAKFNALKEQFSEDAEIKLIKVAKAELIVEFTEEDMQATYCPFATHQSHPTLARILARWRHSVHRM